MSPSLELGLHERAVKARGTVDRLAADPPPSRHPRRLVAIIWCSLQHHDANEHIHTSYTGAPEIMQDRNKAPNVLENNLETLYYYHSHF
jgi:hypothetical protein